MVPFFKSDKKNFSLRENKKEEVSLLVVFVNYFLQT
ncbi:hypothetical protein SSU98_1927 [Streptococcus suis 98HAH33]|nr:hypothetical protein SSU98_1927 [Streptococcus suis 98HAH33]